MKRLSFVLIVSVALLALITSSALSQRVINRFQAPGSHGTWGLTWDGEYLWTSSVAQGNNIIYHMDTEGNILYQFNWDAGIVSGIAWDGEYLYLAGLFEAQIHKMTSDGQWIETIQTPLEQVTGLAWDETDIWACDRPASVPDRRLVRFDSEWNVVEAIPLTFPVALLDGLTWDGESFFITDCYDNTIYQLSRDGQLLWTFPGPGEAATELEWDGEYLWVSDIVSDYIYQLDLSQPPDTTNMYVTPGKLSFIAFLDGENPESQLLTVTSTGDPLDWTASADADWITVDPTSGTTPSEVTVSVDITDLGLGEYWGYVTFTPTDPLKDPVSVPVNLLVDIDKTDYYEIVNYFEAPGSHGTWGLTWDGTYLWTSSVAQNYNIIYHMDTNGNILSQFEWNGGIVSGMAWDGEYLYLAGLFEAQIHKMTADGDWVETIQTSLEQVTGLAWDGTDMWACDRPASVPDRRLVRFDSDWNVVEEIPIGFDMELLDGLTWDGESFFITDCYYNMVYQLTRDGNLMWEFPGPGIAATELEWDGRYLWVSDIVSDRIYQLDLTGAPPDTVPIISVSPSYFEFTAEIEGENPPDQILTITNAGVGELNWTASEDADWLTIYPTSGTAPSEVTLSVDITGLEVGAYNASIIIESEEAWNSPVRVTITLIIKSNVPTIALSPTKFHFNAVVGEANPDPQDLYIDNSGGGTLNWEAEEDLDWLTLSSYSGTAPSVVTLSVDITGLEEGIYYGDIVISAEDATNSPQSVQVVLTMYSEQPPGGDTVRVATVGALPGEEVVVPIYFSNTVSLGGVVVPLIWSSPEVLCDSVSFVGSRVDYLGLKAFNIDAPNRKVLVAAVVTVEPYIPPGKGLFGNLHFTVSQDASQQTVTIDTAFFPPSNVLVFVDENAQEIHPEFVAGHIVIGGLKFGDPNSDAGISVADVVYLINYLFKEGSQPYPYFSGDVNCDNQVNVKDVVYLINYLFRNGPPPLC